MRVPSSRSETSWRPGEARWSPKRTRLATLSTGFRPNLLLQKVCVLIAIITVHFYGRRVVFVTTKTELNKILNLLVIPTLNTTLAPITGSRGFLTYRKEYVNYGGLDSTILNNRGGVPQGSVLRPLLFILFINNIVYISNLGKFFLFADDLNLFLRQIYEYCSANKPAINYDKCCFMEFNL